MLKYLWENRTKVSGYAVVILGVLATSSNVLPPGLLKWIILTNGVVVACIGHYNDMQQKRGAAQ